MIAQRDFAETSDVTTGRAGVAALIGAAALWSLNGPLIKILNAQGDGVDPLLIACMRSLMGGVLFLPLVWRNRGTVLKAGWGWPLFSVSSFTLMTAAFVIANTQTQAANAIVLQYTAPLYVFLLSPWLLREKPGWSEGLALLLALCGVAVIVAWGGTSDGVLIALVSGLGYGLLIIALRGLRHADPAATVAMNFICSGLILLIPVLLLNKLHLTLAQGLILLLMSVVQFAIPYLLFGWALQRVPAVHASLITLLEMIINPVLTFLIVREAPPAATLVGGPLVLAGVAGWVWLSARRARKSGTTA